MVVALLTSKPGLSQGFAGCDRGSEPSKSGSQRLCALERRKPQRITAWKALLEKHCARTGTRRGIGKRTWWGELLANFFFFQLRNFCEGTSGSFRGARPVAPAIWFDLWHSTVPHFEHRCWCQAPSGGLGLDRKVRPQLCSLARLMDLWPGISKRREFGRKCLVLQLQLWAILAIWNLSSFPYCYSIIQNNYRNNNKSINKFEPLSMPTSSAMCWPTKMKWAHVFRAKLAAAAISVAIFLSKNWGWRDAIWSTRRWSHDDKVRFIWFSFQDPTFLQKKALSLNVGLSCLAIWHVLLWKSCHFSQVRGSHMSLLPYFFEWANFWMASAFCSVAEVLASP